MDFALTEEQKAFRRVVLDYATAEIAPLAAEADASAQFCWEGWRKLAELGLLGLHFPEEYGGQAADVLTACIAGEALGEAGVDGGLLLAMGAHTYLCGDTILRHGSEEQKRRYLPRLASGEWVGCMGLTEPEAGSDAAAIRTRAERRGDVYVLNGSKMFITNGPIARVAVIFARTDPDPGSGHGGISAFIVEQGTPGFSAGRELKKLGVRSSVTSELILEDVEVPVENRLGEEGAGFLIALHAVEWDRSALLAPFVGALARALRESAAYAAQRRQFGRPIGRFQAIRHKLADLRIFVDAARLLMYRVAWNKDRGRPLNHLEASIAKLFVGDWGMQAASEALQIFGGYGYMEEYPLERIFRDAKLAQIGGGTSEVQRMVIARILAGERR
jgi:hypothetical protein